MTSDLPVGSAVAAAAAVVYNVGFVVEKQALTRLPVVRAGQPFRLAQTLVRSPRWLAGFVLLLGGLGLQVLALSVAPLSVVQPILASGMVVVAVGSHVVLGERLGGRDRLALAAVVVGLVALGASESSSTSGPGRTIGLARLLAVAAPTVLAALVLFAWAGRSSARRAALVYGLSAGLVYGVAAVATKGVASGVSGRGLLAAVPRVVTGPDLYVLGLSCLLGLVLFQAGLQRSTTAVVVSASTVTSSSYAVAVGSLLFAEHLPSGGAALTLRLAGLVGVLAGVVLLASGRSGGVDEHLVVAPPRPAPPHAVSGGGT